MEYGKLISSAFRIALENRRLWPFGIFAGSGGGGFSFNYSSGGDDGGSSGGESIDIDPTLIVILVAIALVLTLFWVVMTTLSQGALADSVAAADRGERRGFRQALRSGRSSFWRVFGLGLLLVGFTLGTLLVVGLIVGGAVVGVLAATDVVAIRVFVIALSALAALAALLVLLLPLVVVGQHSIRELVLAGARPVAAFRGGWRMLRSNIGPSLILALIQQGLMFAAYVGVGIAAVMVCIPAIVVLVATGGGPAGIVVAGVTALVVIPAALAAAGAVGTFGHGLWTLGYLRMRSRETPSPA